MQSPNGLSTVLAISAAFSFFLAGYGFSRGRIRGALEFAGMMSAAALYTLGYALELTRTDLESMLHALRVEYVGIAFVCYFWILFALRFSGFANPGAWARTLLAVPSALTVGLFWTDPVHHFFYASAWVRTDAPFPLIGVVPGPAYWAHIIVSQIEFLAGTGLLAAYALRADARHRRQAQAVAIASLFPWVSFLVYVSGLAPFGLDVTPLGTIGSGLIVAWALFRLGILELVPAARELAIDSLQDGFLVFDRTGAVADLNDAARALLPGVRLRVGEVPAMVRGDASWLESLRALAGAREGRVDLLVEGGGEKPRRLSVQGLQVGGTGPSSGSVIVIRDVSETAALLDRLTEMAVTDDLTGLFNRRRFFELGAREIEVARRASRPLAVAILDLDHFKLVNDRDGHDAGDQVLRAVGARLSSTLRAGDILCRYGGEELAILMPDTDAAGAAVAAERFRDAIARTPFAWTSRSVALTTSVGTFAGVPGPGEAIEQFLSRADTALYRAKAAGRNRCEAWQPDEPAASDPAE